MLVGSLRRVAVVFGDPLRQQRQIDRLIEENAIMAAELRELRWDAGSKCG